MYIHTYAYVYACPYVFVRVSLRMFVCLMLMTRQWAFVLLQRFAELLGKDEVTHKLVSTRWVCWTMFSGIDCCREAWAFIEKAADGLWGVEVGLQWHFMVECDKTCQKFLYERYGSDRCLFPDALKLVSNAPSGPTRTWNPKRLQIAKRSTCLTHDDRDAEPSTRLKHDDGEGIGCKVTLEPDRSFGVLGAPCVLFSRFWTTYVRTHERLHDEKNTRTCACACVCACADRVFHVTASCLAHHLQVW